MIQGTTEDAAWKICFFFFFFVEILQTMKNPKFKNKADDGFGTVCKVDAGYYSQGFLFSFF